MAFIFPFLNVRSFCQINSFSCTTQTNDLSRLANAAIKTSMALRKGGILWSHPCVAPAFCESTPSKLLLPPAASAGACRTIVVGICPPQGQARSARDRLGLDTLRWGQKGKCVARADSPQLNGHFPLHQARKMVQQYTDGKKSSSTQTEEEI